MDITATANALLPLLGGKENIASAAHCATRLRRYWWTTAKWIKRPSANWMASKAVSATPVRSGDLRHRAGQQGACGIHQGGRRQRIQQGRSRRYRGEKLNPLQRIARLLSNIFVPIIPAIVASGLLMGLLGMVKTYGWADANSALFIMLDMFSSAAFIILPILIGFTAAREFGGNPYLGATLGGILTHPALTNAGASPEGSTP